MENLNVVAADKSCDPEQSGEIEAAAAVQTDTSHVRGHPACQRPFCTRRTEVRSELFLRQQIRQIHRNRLGAADAERIDDLHYTDAAIAGGREHMWKE